MRTLLAPREALCFWEEEGGSWLEGDGRKREETMGSWMGSR